MRRIGILGGLGPEATDLFCSELVKLSSECGLVSTPSFKIQTVDMNKFIQLMPDKEKEIAFVEAHLQELQSVVDFIVSPCNTIHYIITQMRELSSVPILAIHEEVVKNVVAHTVSKVGILGTRKTIESGFYQEELDKHNVLYEVLLEGELSEFDTNIFSNILGTHDVSFTNKLLREHIRSFHKMGCDAVILACTELPLFITQGEVEIRLFSSTHILAKATLDYALTD